MITLRSRQRNRFNQQRRSAQNYNEPPTNRSLPATDVEQGPEDRWGHRLGEKQPGIIRFILQNVDGIPTHEDGDIKLDCLKQFANENQADIIALTELNTAWDKLPYNTDYQGKRGVGGMRATGASRTTRKINTEQASNRAVQHW